MPTCTQSLNTQAKTISAEKSEPFALASRAVAIHYEDHKCGGIRRGQGWAGVLHGRARRCAVARRADGAQRGLHLLAAEGARGRRDADRVPEDQQRVPQAEHEAREGHLPARAAHARL